MLKTLLTLVITAYSTALAADTLELSPTEVAINPGSSNLSDLTGTSDIVLETVLGGTSGTYDTTKIFPKHTPEFSLNNEVVVATTSDISFLFMKNLIIEGDGSNRDGEVLTLSSRVLSPNTPYPNPDPYELYLNSIHVADATLSIDDPNKSLDPAIDNGVSIESIEHLQLDNAAFKIKIGTGSIRFNNANVATLVANSGQNIFEVAGSDFNAVKLDVIIESNAGLTLQNTSTISAQDGSLQMKSGSSLTLKKSAVVLDSPNRSSNLEGATVNLSGTFGTALANGVGSSHLDLNNPNIKDSTFNLDNNTAFRARGRVFSGVNNGLLKLGGTNIFTLGDGAFVTASGDNADRYHGEINVNGGTSSFVSSVTGAVVGTNGLFASRWDVANGGILSLERVYGARGVNSIYLSSGSTLKLHTLDNLENLSTLDVIDSTVESSIAGFFESSSIVLSNATLIPEKLNSQDHIGITFSGTSPSANNVVLRGKNSIKLDITPQGRNITPLIKVYNDEFNIYDSTVTGAVVGVSGFDTLHYELNSQTAGLTPKDFAIGGAQGDGRYTMSNLAGSSIDGDTPSISLTPTMPALLQASLDSTPSIDKTVVIKLSELPTTALATLPQLVNSHQAQTITTVTTEPDTDNVSTISVTITPEASGTATKTVNTIITEPNGNLLSNTITVSILAPTTGTKNTENASKLLANSAQKNITVASHLQQLTQQQLTEQFPSIHPEPYSSFATIGLEQSDMTLKTVMRHASNVNTFSLGKSFSQSFSDDSSGELNGGAINERSDTSHTYWYEVTHLNGDIDGDSDLGSYDYRLSALTLGRTFVSTDNYAWGGFLSTGQSRMDEHDLVQQDFKSDNFDIGVYHYSNHGSKLELASVIGFGLSNIESERNFSFANANYNANARYDSKTAYAGVNANYALASFDWVEFRTHAGIHGIYSQQDSVKESGAGPYNILIDKNENAAIITSLGLHSFFGSISEKHEINPMLGLTYEHDWYADDNQEHDINAGIAATPGYKQKFDGQNRGANAWIVDAGLRGSIFENGIIDGGVNYTENSNGKEWGAGVRVEWPF